MKRRKPKHERASPKFKLEVRRDPDGIDEIVAWRPTLIHIERMSDQYVWMGITSGKRRIHVRFFVGNRSRAKVQLEIEDDG